LHTRDCAPGRKLPGFILNIGCAKPVYPATGHRAVVHPVSDFPTLYGDQGETACMRHKWLFRHREPGLRPRPHRVARECMQSPRCMYTPSSESGTKCIDREVVRWNHSVVRFGTVEPFIRKQYLVTLERRQLPHRMDNCT